jgi:hypothetical protein
VKKLFAATAVYGLVVTAILAASLRTWATSRPEPVVPEPRSLYQGTLPTGQTVVFVVDCPSLFEASQVVAVTLHRIAADSAGATCVHPAIAAEALTTEVKTNNP